MIISPVNSLSVCQVSRLTLPITPRRIAALAFAKLQFGVFRARAEPLDALL